MDLKKLAYQNLAALAANPYPGRGLIVGLDEAGENLIQVYWIMGRSANSRNRIFIEDEDRVGVLKTAPANLSKVQDPSLIIYTAMDYDEMTNFHVVTNGHHTGSVLRDGLENLAFDWGYEPDAPNFTPRIGATAFFDDQDNHFAQLALLKKSPFFEGNQAGEGTDFYFYELSIFPGCGYCVTTYSGDGDPLPSFTGDPYLLPLSGSIEDIAQTIWKALDPENRVSLAVKSISREGEIGLHIINKYSQVE